MHEMAQAKWKFTVNFLHNYYKFMEILKFTQCMLCLIILFVLKLINHKISAYNTILLYNLTIYRHAWNYK